MVSTIPVSCRGWLLVAIIVVDSKGGTRREQDLGEVQSVVIYVVVVQFYGSQLLFALVYDVRRSHDFWVCRNLVKQDDLACASKVMKSSHFSYTTVKNGGH